MYFKVTYRDCSLDYRGINNSNGSLLQIIFPIISIVNSLGKAFDLPIGDTMLNVFVHNDNAGALVLAITFPSQFAPCSNHYATKTIWFSEYIVKRGINILKMDTVE